MTRGPEVAPRRRPEQLLLAFFGELVVDKGVEAVPAAVLLEVLEELELAPTATRATLARMVARGLLGKRPSGRSVSYLLAPEGERVLREARDRVFADEPFAPEGSGWTLVTFSIPEARRDVRHRVRARLTWAGFGLVRDGLWIAPGEVDVARALDGLPEEDAELDLLAFRAEEVPGFPVAESLAGAWDLEAIRERHESFQAAWAETEVDAGHALRDLTALVADWLDLLRAAPRLPVAHLGTSWPSARSVETFRRLHRGLAPRARVELAQLLAD